MPGFRPGQQLERRVGRAGLVLGLRGGERAPGLARRVGGQLGRTLKERGRRGQAAAGLRPSRGPLEFTRDILVGVRNGMSAVPGTAIGIELRIDHLRQRGVHPPAIGRRCASVSRRAHQRMPEPHPDADLEQPGRFGKTGRLGAEPEPAGRPPHQHRVAGRLGRRDHEQPPGILGQVVDPPQEAVLDLARQRLTRPPEAAGQLGR
jgi:hypothetical protein